MNDQFKVFHFQELDWLLYFPNNEGNSGKYCGYTVLLKEKKKSGADHRVNLGDTVERREFEEHYPHTVGFFKGGSGEEGEDCKPQYMELRIIHNIDEFWLFLNALNL